MVVAIFKRLLVTLYSYIAACVFAGVLIGLWVLGVAWYSGIGGVGIGELTQLWILFAKIAIVYCAPAFLAFRVLYFFRGVRKTALFGLAGVGSGFWAWWWVAGINLNVGSLILVMAAVGFAAGAAYFQIEKIIERSMGLA